MSAERPLATLQHLQQLTSYGVQWRSYTEQYIDSCGIFADVVISIMAVLARQEKIRISERTKAGLARAKRQGKQLGRPREVTPDAVRKLRAEGLSWSAIAQKLDIAGSTAQLHARDPKPATTVY